MKEQGSEATLILHGLSKKNNTSLGSIQSMQALCSFPQSYCCGRGRSMVICVVVLLAAAVVSLGCGKDKRNIVPLTGKVTFDGKPLQFGAVTILHDHGQPATAVIQPDGTFTMATLGEGDGAVVGKWRVRVVCYENQDPSKTEGAVMLGKLLIPERYTDIETSGLTVEVRPDRNEPLVINLTK